jgi:hypothetical protein
LKRLLALALLALPACFNVDQQPCTYACGPGGACPDDYQCLADGYCHLHGEPAACGYSDMAMTLDANVDMSMMPDQAMPDSSMPADGSAAVDASMPVDAAMAGDSAMPVDSAQSVDASEPVDALSQSD